jgi:glucose/arabinose dehydrogenase
VAICLVNVEAQGMRPSPGTTVAAFLVMVCSACAGSSDGTPVGARSTATAPSSTATAGTPSATGERVLTAAVDRVIATGLEVPWGLAFLPDGSALVSERDTDRVKRVSTDGTVSVVGTVDGVDGGGEGGLLGLALSPSYDSDHFLFAYYTHGDENVIARMTYDDAGLSGQQEVFDGIPSGSIHNGGRLAFGPDGYLYVGTGEAGRGGPAQDKDDLGGKILRITPGGDPAPGNPFEGSPVWTYGHRNVQGLAFDQSGQLWASEFGQNTWDELNRIEKGGNYGWPVVEGRAGQSGYVDPVREWHTDVASPSGIAIAGNAVFMAGLRGERLWQIPIPGGTVGKPTALLTGKYGRLRTVAVAPDGSLWLTTSNRDGRGSLRQGDDRIIRLTLS